jgi:hypothetical protein
MDAQLLPQGQGSLADSAEANLFERVFFTCILALLREYVGFE